MKLTIYTLLCFLFLSNPIFAQTPDCGTDELHHKKMLLDPDYKKGMEKSNQLIYDVMSTSSFTESAIVHTIPVVVHVMHASGEAVGTGSNISVSQIEAGIAHLNDAFRNVGDYAGGPFFSNAGISSADVEIEFCLAVRDPSGNSTNGINRVATSYTNLDRDEACSPPSGSDTQDDCVKALSFWPSTDYMNVWLVNEICTGTAAGGNYSCATAGYAYLAGAHGAIYDGIVNEAGSWGFSTNSSTTHIHEVGHYLNLYHPFEGGCAETDCLSGGDLVCDTPPDNSTDAVSCSSSNTANTCNNDASITNSPFTSDVEDIYEGYMDYGFSSCKNTFTPDQKTRMRLALTTTRSSLLSSTGCQPPAPPVSDFTSNTTLECEGGMITFEDLSSNIANAWDWSFPGGTPSSSTDENPIITYNTAGTYTVTLIASNGLGTGTTETKTEFITISDLTFNAANCTPELTNQSTMSNNSLGITNVSLANINNTTPTIFNEGSAYVDYSCQEIANLVTSTNYTLSVTAGTSFNSENVNAWIDYNGDGEFDASEQIINMSGLSGGAQSQNFTAAATPVVGQVVIMRVVSDFGTPTNCENSAGYAMTEDYGIIFEPAVPAAPESDFAADFTGGCIGTIITYQDLSANFPTSWNWSFPGGTPSSSTDQNPVITYNSEGTFDVTLITSNAIGGGTTETKSGYVSVVDVDPAMMNCTPSLTNQSITGNYTEDGISNVSLATINNTTLKTVGDGSAYMDFTCQEIAYLDPGTNYTLSVTSASASFPENVNAWIDYNGDGDFDDAGELIYSQLSLAGTAQSQSFTTEAFPLANTLLVMRVASVFNATPTNCEGATSYGQTEDYGIYFESMALPIELSSFDATLTNQKTVQLDWQTLSEIDNDYFLLERSFNGQDYQTLATIQSAAVDGAGTTYRFIDDAPMLGLNYYRLTQVDLDGTLKVEGVRVIELIPDKVKVKIQPNPVTSDILILKYETLSDAPLILEITDINGRVIIERKLQVETGDNTIEVLATDLSNGLYFMRTIQNQDIKTSRFVKTN